MITQFPASNSLSYEEMASLLNRALVSMKYMSPIMNTKLGQVVPDADFLRAGMIAYADGTNWNPLSDGVAGYFWYNGSAWKRLAVSTETIADGTANYKLFMNAAGNGKEWAKGIVVKNYTRDMSSAGAPTDVTYTGFGFKPSAYQIIYSNTATAAGIGWTDGTSSQTILNNPGGGVQYWHYDTSKVVYAVSAPGLAQSAVHKSMDSDGITLTWTKIGAPTGTLYMSIIGYR